MFWIKNKKNGIPLHTPVSLYIKVGYKGVYFSWTCFLIHFSAAEPSQAPSTSKTVGDSSTSDTPGPSTKYTNLQPKPALPKSPQKSHVAVPSQSYPVKTAGKLYGDKDKYTKQKSVSVTEPVPQVF